MGTDVSLLEMLLQTVDHGVAEANDMVVLQLPSFSIQDGASGEKANSH